MKYKYTPIIFILFLLILCIGAVNATDTDHDDDKQTTTDSDTSFEKNINKVSKENREIAKTSTTATKKTRVDVDADEVAVEYNKTKYLTIKLEDKNDDPIITKINAKVVSKTKNKTYSLTSNDYGIAKLNTKSLSMGNHKVIINSADNKYSINKQTNIFVGKKETVTLTLNKQKTLPNKDTLKLVTKQDEEDTEVTVAYNGVPKYTKVIKAKFYYKNKVNGKVLTEIDLAEFDDGRWELPNEDYNTQRYALTKVEVDYLTSKSTKTPSTISTQNSSTTTITAKKVKADVEADEVAVEYKKNNYLKIKIEDNNDHSLKNTQIMVKVFTGTKSTTYKLTTNSYGIAKLNTKNLSLGNHKVSITSNNSKYIINKQTNIFVGKKGSVTINANSQKVLKNKDTIKIVTKKINNYKDEVIVAYNGVPKYTKVVMAKFYYKNKVTGKVYTETDYADFDDGRWELPDEDYNRNKYTLTKVEVQYVTSK